jgi:hypothetical protein
MKFRVRVIITAALLVTATVATIGISYAQGHSGTGTRPGWGFGDKHHKHIGPPGQSVSVHPGHHHHKDKDDDKDGGHHNGKDD